MNIAHASLEELRDYFVLASDPGYAETAAEQESIAEIGRMLSAYTRALLTVSS